MGVVLRNLQKVVPLRRARLRRDVDMLRHILGVQKFDLGIICVDNKRIQQINHIYRKKNVPTDVLSFPFYEVCMATWLHCILLCIIIMEIQLQLYFFLRT